MRLVLQERQLAGLWVDGTPIAYGQGKITQEMVSRGSLAEPVWQCQDLSMALGAGAEGWRSQALNSGIWELLGQTP